MSELKIDVDERVGFIKAQLSTSSCDGVVFGNSGGKDSALVGILSKMATDNTLGIIMPCGSSVNYSSDMEHAKLLAEKFDIETSVIDLTAAKDALIGQTGKLKKEAEINIAPRLRMTTLYAVAANRNFLVAGTGNLCERYIGYFTKYGDGGCDFNPIGDLTVSKIYELLAYLGAPDEIIDKAPSAGLFEGQTDESEIGVTYKAIEEYILYQTGEPGTVKKIERMHEISEHKRLLPTIFSKE